MNNTCTESPPPMPTTLVDGKYYRVWSLTGRGYLTLIPKDGVKKNADFSGTGNSEENSSKIKASRTLAPVKNGFSLEFQEDESKYILQANDRDEVSVELCADCDPGDRALFVLRDFGPHPDFHVNSYFKALEILEPAGKCLASNGAKGLSLKDYNSKKPHADTLFLVTEA